MELAKVTNRMFILIAVVAAVVASTLTYVYYVSGRPTPYEVVVCGENTLPCPPPHGEQVLARFLDTWYVAGYGARTGWRIQGVGYTTAWPEEWREID